MSKLRPSSQSSATIRTSPLPQSTEEDGSPSTDSAPFTPLPPPTFSSSVSTSTSAPLPSTSPSPSPSPSGSTVAADVAKRLNAALDDPQIREELLRRMQEIGLADRGPKLDITNDQCTVLLDGLSILRLTDAWQRHNEAAMPGDRLDFSRYLALRIQRCNQHAAERHLYLHGEDLQRIETIADENFVDGYQLSVWVARTRQFQIPLDENGTVGLLGTINPQVLVRLLDRLYDGETLIHLVNRITQKALHEYTGVDYLEPWD